MECLGPKCDLKGGMWTLRRLPALWEGAELKVGWRVGPLQDGNWGRCSSCPGLQYSFWLFDLSASLTAQSPSYFHFNHPQAQFHYGPPNPSKWEIFAHALLLLSFLPNIFLLQFFQWMIISFLNMCRQAPLLFIPSLSSHPLNQFKSISKICLFYSLFLPSSCFAIC